MRLTIVYVFCKFHKNLFYSKCPYVTMFVDLKIFRPLWAREHGAGEGSIGASSRGQEAPWMG